MNVLKKRFDERWTLLYNKKYDKCEICDGALKEVLSGKFSVYERDSLVSPTKFVVKKEHGHDTANAYGREEIIANKEKHTFDIANMKAIELKEVIDLAKQRYQHIAMDQEIKSILFYYNNFSYKHFSFRLFALPIIPLDLSMEYNFFLRNKMESSQCIFCTLVNSENPLFEDENIKVIKSNSPRFSHEFVILPKRHIKDITELTDDESLSISEAILNLIKLLKSHRVNFYEFAFYNAPVGEDFHLHIYVNSVELKDTLSRYGLDVVYKG